METHPNIDDDDDFGGDFSDNHDERPSANKRSFGELDDDEYDIFGSKKVNSKLEEMTPGAAAGMILSLRENLEKAEDDLDQCRMELDASKYEIQKWHSSFQNDSFIPAGTNPEPKMIVNYVQTLRSSEKSLKEQLEKAKKKEAAFIVTFAKREQEVAELKAVIRELRAQLKPPSMQELQVLQFFYSSTIFLPLLFSRLILYVRSLMVVFIDCFFLQLSVSFKPLLWHHGFKLFSFPYFPHTPFLGMCASSLCNDYTIYKNAEQKNMFLLFSRVAYISVFIFTSVRQILSCRMLKKMLGPQGLV